MPLVGLYLVNKVSSSFIHVYISKRQCMRDTGSDECQILLLLYWYQHVVLIYNYLKHNICLTKTKIQLHILITCHLYAQCGWYVLIHPAMIYVSYKYDDK
jgi:hypothetical protein